MKFVIGDYVKVRSCWVNWSNCSGSISNEYFIEKNGVITEVNVKSPYFVIGYRSTATGFQPITDEKEKNTIYYRVFIDKLRRHEIIEEKEMEKLA